MANKDAIKKRQQEVLKLMLTGMTITEIAEKTGQSTGNVSRDMQKVRSEMKHSNFINNDDPVSDFILRNRNRYKKAHELYLYALSPKDRNGAHKEINTEEAGKNLDRMNRIDDQLIIALQNTGMVSKNLGTLNVRNISVSFKSDSLRFMSRDGRVKSIKVSENEPEMPE